MKNTLILLLVLCSLTAAAEKDTIDIKITGNYTYYLDEDEDEGTTDWYFSAFDDTGKYQVRIDRPGGMSDKYGTSTNEDIDPDYSYIKDYSGEEMEYRNYEEGTTVTFSDNDGKLHIEGLLVCDNGVVYRLWMEHSPQTYTVEGTSLTDIYYFTDDTDWYISFKNKDFLVSLDLITGAEDRFAGTYTEANSISGYTYASDLNTSSTDYFKTMNVTLSLFDGYTDPTNACEIRGTALSEHGDTYNFHMVKYPPIQPKKNVDVDVNVKYCEWPSKSDDYKSYFELEEAKGGSRWTIATDALIGKITDGIIDSMTMRKDSQSGETLNFDNGTAILTIDPQPETLNLEVDARLVMKDSVQYHMTFGYPIETKGSRTFNFNNLTLSNSSYSEVGYQWLDCSNDSCKVELTLTDDIPGAYDDNTCTIKMVVKDPDGEMSVVNNLAIINASTTLDEHNQPVLEARFLGSDKKVYTLNAHLDIPEIKDTLNITIDSLRARDYIEKLGVFQITGYNRDSTVYVALAPEATQFEGHYTTESLTAYYAYSFLALKKLDGTYEKNGFYTADFDVTKDEDTLHVAGKFQSGSHFIRLTLKATIRPDGIEYDTEDEDLDASFTAADLYSIEKSSSYAYVELRNKQRSDIFTILFYLNKFDEETVIPVGTYEVNSTYSAPSVQPGIYANDNLYPCFYATIGDNEYLYRPFWFLTSGTVTVSKTEDKCLKFEVNGKNSYGCAIHVVYDGTGSGIGEVQGGSKGLRGLRGLNGSRGSRGLKRLLDGRIVIEKNGQRYTLTGQQY